MTANHSAVAVAQMKSVDATERAVWLPSNKKCRIRHYEHWFFIEEMFCFIRSWFTQWWFSSVDVVHQSTDRIKLWAINLRRTWKVVSPSWIKRDQLDATCFIITLSSAQHVSEVNTSTLRSLRLISWVTSWVVSGSMCVGVTLQCGYGGVVWYPYAGWSSASACIRIPHRHSHTAT